MHDYISREKKTYRYHKYDVVCKIFDWYFCKKIRHQLRLHTGYRVIQLTESRFLVYLHVSPVEGGSYKHYIGLCDHHTYEVVLTR